MKRILLELECIESESLLPYNYQTAIRAYIYNRIGTGDEQFAEDLHKSNSYKFFTFSFLDFLPDTYRTTRQGILLNATTKGSLVVSFYHEEAATAFIQGIEETPIMELLGVEFDIINAEFLDNPTFSTRSKCSCLSPLFISYTKDNNVKFYHPKEKNAANLLEENLYNKAIKVGLVVDRDRIKFIPRFVRNSKLLKDKHTILKTYMTDFELLAPIEVQKLAYFGGVGEKNSLGLGCFIKQ